MVTVDGPNYSHFVVLPTQQGGGANTLFWAPTLKRYWRLGTLKMIPEAALNLMLEAILKTDFGGCSRQIPIDLFSRQKQG